jgi:NADH-quinone oxidoreductase subunit C
MTPTFGSRYPSLHDIREAVEQAHSGSVLEGRESRTETTLIIRADAIRGVCTYLRDDAGWRFNLLADIAGVDWPERERRFDVVYNL